MKSLPTSAKAWTSSKAMPKKVLIVEDETSQRNALAKKLESEGFTVATAPDGQTGLESLTEETPDLVLLDLLMPRLGGVEMLEELDKRGQVFPGKIVVLSNFDNIDRIRRANELGVTDYWVKTNITLDEVVTRVNNILEEK